MTEVDPYEQMQQLLGKLASAIGNALKYAPPADHDARRITVANLLTECEAAATVNSLLQPVLMDPYHTDHLKLMRAASKERVPAVLKMIVLNSKNGLVVNWVFQMEHFANLLSSVLGRKTKQIGGFDHSSLLKELGVSDADVRGDCLLALQLIRNALHNNGVHAKKSRSIKVNGEDFDFVQGEPVLCASWSHVLSLMILSADTLAQYLKAKAVQAITLIEDPYSSKHGLERARQFEELTQELREQDTE